MILWEVKTEIEKSLRIHIAKQILSFKNSVLEDDTLEIFHIPGIGNNSELTTSEDTMGMNRVRKIYLLRF